MSNRDSTSPHRKPCRVCSEEIDKNARKCIHCGSWQDWHRRIGLSSEILALLIALTSVIGWVTPIITDALTPEKSNIFSTFQADSYDYVSALVSNSGARAGSITLAVLSFPATDGKGTWQIALEVVTTDESNALVIPAGSSIMVRFKKGGLRYIYFNAKGSIDLLKHHGAEASNLAKAWVASSVNGCSLEYHYSNFDGSPSRTSEPVICRDVIRFIFSTNGD